MLWGELSASASAVVTLLRSLIWNSYNLSLYCSYKKPNSFELGFFSSCVQKKGSPHVMGGAVSVS